MIFYLLMLAKVCFYSIFPIFCMNKPQRFLFYIENGEVKTKDFVIEGKQISKSFISENEQ